MHPPKILIVEDDSDISDYIKSEILKSYPYSEIVLVTNKTDAFAALQSEAHFDLLSLDLKIPIEADSSDIKTEYGNAVLHFARMISPGLPILILTASSTDGLVSDFLESSDQADIWGDGVRRPTVAYAEKKRLDKYAAKLQSALSALKALKDIEVNKSPDNLELSAAHSRLIRIFARRNGAARCDISAISGGLSGSWVYSLSAFDGGGKLVRNVIAKVADHETVQTEDQNYDIYVSRLRPDTTPRRIETMVYGAGKTAAVFYGLENKHSSDFFAACTEDANDKLLTHAQGLTDRWCASSSELSKTISEIRRLLLNDIDTERIIKENDLEWAEEFEKSRVQTKWCCIHGDMHGKNILVDLEEQSAVLIDYGDVKEGPPSLDPTTLEFSNFFHPDGTRSGTWPTLEQAENWSDLESYLVNCPNPKNIKFLRDWAISVSAGKRERAASAYSYLMRQLKYTDTNKELVLALLKGTKRLYEGT